MIYKNNLVILGWKQGIGENKILKTYLKSQ